VPVCVLSLLTGMVKILQYQKIRNVDDYIYLCENVWGSTHVAVDMMYYTVQMLDGILTASNVSAYTAGRRNVKFAHWK
jgi:hypothetical protein